MPRHCRSASKKQRFTHSFWSRMFGEPVRAERPRRAWLGVEQLEQRWVMAGNPVVTFVTNQGNIDIELFAETQPITVQNFLEYVNDESYIDSFIHRSVNNFVIQGGGFSHFNADENATFQDIFDISEITTNTPIQNEPGRSNLRGTVAMAKLGGDPNSATSQFFFNLGNNSANLDAQNGGFTVFGQVINNTMTTVDAIAALNRVDIDPDPPGDDERSFPDGTGGSILGSVPLFRTATGQPLNQLVTITDVVGNGTVTGAIYKDLDGNGVRALDSADEGTLPDEPGLVGITVFADADADGLFDAGEISAVTNAQGVYELTLPSGAHTIRQVPANPLILIDPDFEVVDVAIGRATTDIDFGNTSDILTQFTVQITRPDGTVVAPGTSLKVGDQFKLNVFIEDPSPGVTDPNLGIPTTGVDIAALDVLFNTALAEFLTVATSSSNPSGVDIGFGPDYQFFPGLGESSAAEPLNEVETSRTLVGSNFPPAGPGKFLLFTVNMRAKSAGTVTFQTDAADGAGNVINVATTGQNGTSGLSSVTPTASQISFGSAQLNIVSDLAAANDIFSVKVDSSANVLNVLGNDTKNPAGTFVITGTGPTNNGGSAAPSVDNLSLVYTPAVGFLGTETFTYSLNDGTGGPAVTATVTVNVQDLPAAADDAATAAEDSIDNVIDVLINDEANVGRTNSVTVVSNPANGTAALITSGANAGKIRYTPAANFFGTDTFTYSIADGSGAVDTATVTVTVTNVGDAPTAVANAATTAEETAVVIDVLANDTDIDNNPLGNLGLVVNAVTQGTNGTVAIIASGADLGKIRYTPALNFFGTDTFTYTIFDAQSNPATATVTVTVTNVQDAPTAVANSFTVTKNTGVQTFDVLANDSDVDNQPASNAGLTVTAVTASANGTAAVATGGTGVTYTPNANFIGTDTFTYTTTDASGGTATATVTVQVLDFIPSTISGFTYIDANRNGVRDANELVLEGVTVTLAGTGLAGAVNTSLTSNTSGFYEFTGLAPGSYTVTESHPKFLVDGEESVGIEGGVTVPTDQISITNLVQNTQGTGNNFGELRRQGNFSRLSDFFARRGDMVIRGAGTQQQDSIQVALQGAATQLWMARSGEWKTFSKVDVQLVSNGTQVQIETTDATQQVRRATIPLTRSDLVQVLGTQDGATLLRIKGRLNQFTFTTLANNNPTAVVDTATLAEDSAATTVNVLTNDSFAPDLGETLTVTAITQGANGTVAINTGNSSVRYTPNANFNGTDTFTYTISDGRGGTATANVNVTVTPVADNPPAVNDTLTVSEDSVAAALNVLANDTPNPDVGETLTITAITQGANGVVAIATGAAGLTYTPNANFVGTDTFTYIVNDGSASATATVTVSVAAVADAPTAVVDAATVAENSAITTVDVLLNDLDVDNVPASNVGLTVTAITAATNGTAAIVSGGGAVTYIPNANFAGSDSFTYTVTDAQGNTATATVNVTVTNAANSPIGVAESVTTAEETAAVIDVLLNDTDADNVPASNIGLSVSAVTQGTSGLVEIIAAGPDLGKVRYTPAANFVGSDSFTYTVSDPQNNTAVVTVNVTVTNVANNPVATTDTVSTLIDAAVVVDVLANDTDVDNQPLSNVGLTVTAVTAGANGTAEIIATAGPDLGKVRYTPGLGFHGSDSFTYTISDGQGNTATGTVNVSVVAAPTATADVFDAPNAVPEDSIAAPLDVLANDLDLDNDPDSNAGLTVTAVTQGTNGSVAIAAGALGITYTPTANFVGTDTFSYTISDPQGNTATATVNVTVTDVADNPTAVLDTATTLEETAQTIDVLLNDFDVDNVPQSNVGLAVTQITQGTGGSVAISGDTLSVVYTPALDFFGADSFTYTVSDPQGNTATGTVNVTVTNVDDNPTAVTDNAVTAAGAAVAIDVLANDLDVDNQPTSNVGLIVGAVTQGANGAVEVLTSGPNAGQPQYTPDAGFSGSDSFTYTVTDPEGNSATTTVNVTVTAAEGEASPSGSLVDEFFGGFAEGEYAAAVDELLAGGLMT